MTGPTEPLAPLTSVVSSESSLPLPSTAPPTCSVSSPKSMIEHGAVQLSGSALRNLRHARYLSQQDLVDDFDRRNIQVSIATIKRAELGRRVRFRIARTLAGYFGVPIEHLLFDRS
jgi:hypothetical protein